MPKDVTLNMITETTRHPGTLRLKSITYSVDAVGESTTTIMEGINETERGAITFDLRWRNFTRHLEFWNMGWRVVVWHDYSGIRDTRYS